MYQSAHEKLKQEAITIADRAIPLQTPIRVLLIGNPGSGKSCFTNFAYSYFQYALGVSKNYSAVVLSAAAGEHGKGVTQALSWVEICKSIRISDTRGFENLTRQAKANITSLALGNASHGLDMGNAELERLGIAENDSFWRGAECSHHVVLYFLNAKEHAQGRFDVAEHDKVADLVFGLQSNSFHPIIVITNTDLVQEEQVRVYVATVESHMRQWRQFRFFGKNKPLYSIPPIKQIANIADSEMWSFLRDEDQVEMAFRGKAMLSLLATCVDAGIKYMNDKPSFGENPLSWMWLLVSS